MISALILAAAATLATGPASAPPASAAPELPHVPVYDPADCLHPDRVDAILSSGYASGEVEKEIREYGAERQVRIVKRMTALNMSVEDKRALLHQLGGAPQVRKAVAAGQAAWNDAQPWYKQLKADPKGPHACEATAHVSSDFAAMLAASRQTWDSFDKGLDAVR